MSSSVAEVKGAGSVAELRQAIHDQQRAFMAEMAELKESKQTDRQMRETDRRMQETDRRLKKAEDLFTTPWRWLMESLVEGDLVPLLKERGIAVEGTTERTVRKRNGEHFEIDILAVNGAEVVVVEVKTTLRSEGETRFLGKLARFVDWCPEYRGHTVDGAVAFLQSDPAVVTCSERQGLFVIRATGNSASIVNAADFEPRAFS